MADRLIEMEVFRQVVDSGSFSAAGRVLQRSVAVVSRRVGALERRLGVRLLNRTTRSLTLTAEGQAFYAHCRRIADDIEAAELEAAAGRASVAGLLRVTSTVAFARQLAPLLHEFQQRNPAVEIRLHATDAMVDLVDGGFDLAIRVGRLVDSSLVARELAPGARVICAAPSYLARRGRPRRPADLTDHDCVLMGEPAVDVWRFADGTEVQVRGPLSSNDGETAHRWTLAGAGLVMKSVWDVQADIANGRLEVVLAGHPLPSSPIHAVYPHRRHVARRVGACADFLQQVLQSRAPAVLALAGV